MTQLSGKIYFVESDFLFNHVYIPKKDETSFIVTSIENAIIEEHMIQFSTTPYEYNGEILSYNINLLINDNGLNYSGTFSEKTDQDWNGPVSCELFENKKNYFMYGKWTEDEVVLTWWARIEKFQTGNIIEGTER